MTITAAADGSALGNPGPAGWAWYVDDSTWRSGGWPHGTNNQGELMAVLDLLRSTESAAGEKLHILCDSQYVINCITKWLPGWKRKGWKKADGKPVLNVDLLQQLDAALAGRSYAFEWVKGHAGHDLNEAADQRARAAATAYSQKRQPDAGPGFRGRSGLSAGHEAAMEAAASDAGGEDAAGEAAQGELDFGATQVRVATNPADVVELLAGYDRELLNPDAGRAAELLAQDYLEIGATGALWDRDALVAQGGNGATSLSLVETVGGAEAAGTAGEAEFGSLTLIHHAKHPQGTALQSSHWRRSAGLWQLVFRQTTPAR